MKADAFDPKLVGGAVRAALGGRTAAPLHAPPLLSLADGERLAVMIGSYPVGYRWVNEFEARVAQRVQRKHAIAVSSGTAALHLALAALDIHGSAYDEGHGSDSVAVPGLTFAGCAAAVMYTGAVPYFYPGYMPRLVKAVIGVDLLGIPMDDWINEHQWPDERPPLILDAAQSLGSTKEKQCGSFGDVSILSFNNNKIVTTGGGGMVLTDDDAIAERVRYLATTAKVPSPHHYVHTEVGYNYRMPNACAALGLVMLDKLDDTLTKKARLHQRYQAAFADVPGVAMVEAPEGVVWNHWLNAIEVPAGQRDATLNALTATGYECRALYTPLPWLEPYKRFAQGQTFPEAERRFATTVCLPSGPELAQ